MSDFKVSALPYLCVKGAAAALDFYQKAFGAVELFRFDDKGEKIGHAEIQIGGATIMLADEYPEMGILSPQSLGGSPVSIWLLVEDVDAFFNRAVEAGAVVLRPLKDEFYGHRAGHLRDPFGHRWDVSMVIKKPEGQ